MSQFINALNDFIWGPPLIILMLGTGLYFTIGSKFFQIRYFNYIMKQTLGKIFKKQDENNAEGVLSPLEAVSTAIGGSVGFGNIAGVATAIAMGGPGATLWMWITAFLGMILKQVEVTLAVYYRKKDENGFGILVAYSFCRETWHRTYATLLKGEHKWDYQTFY